MRYQPRGARLEVKGFCLSPSSALRLSAGAGAEGGFTLIELLIVLVITVLGISVVAVNISSGKATMEHKAAVRDIVSALRYARGQALTNHRDAEVTFDLTGNNYTVTGRDRTFAIPESLDVTLVTAQSELAGEGRGTIRFFADGSSTGGRVTLERGEAVWRIDINWLTGQVEVDDDARL